MFAIKRNQVIVTALVVMIAVAGYLNFSDSRVNQSPGLTYTLEDDINSLLDEGIEVISLNNSTLTMENLTNADIMTNNPSILLTTSENEDDENVEAVFLDTNINPDTFFVQAKLDRENSRSQQQELLLNMINNQNLDQPQRAQFADAMLDIQRRIERESAAEAMIESRGFRGVFVRIGDNSVDVVVDKENLTEAEAAQIEDIIRRKTGMDVTEIRISTLRR
ncbi:MAG: SpoIIIAH-like family protein [Defluviitaleaceae bacterium]|nr:SpoIIIAH-like family protein [Defluviitaleaceae bacterium]